MDALDVSRWQFGITTVYHFIFVPLTIGLAPLIAVMQNPVGAHYNPETGRAELTSIVALFTNNTAIAAFSHAVAGAFLTAGTFVAGVCVWWMVRASETAEARTMYRPAAILGCLVTLVAAAG